MKRVFEANEAHAVDDAVRRALADAEATHTEKAQSPPEPRARMAVIRDSLSPVDAASAFASAAAARASRRSGGRREPNTPLSRGMSEPERGV